MSFMSTNNRDKTFASIQTIEKLNIYHKVSCKSSCYLLECLPCKMQYVRKSETPFRIRLNKHKKEIKNPKCYQSMSTF